MLSRVRLKKMWIVALLLGAVVVALAPVVTRPTLDPDDAEYMALRKACWDQARRTASVESTASMALIRAEQEKQQALFDSVHLRGGHIDEGHEPCRWFGYRGAWRILLGRLGLT